MLTKPCRSLEGGKHGNDLYAFKFASSQAYRDFMQKSSKDEHSDDSGNSEHSESE